MCARESLLKTCRNENVLDLILESRKPWKLIHSKETLRKTQNSTHTQASTGAAKN